MLLILVTACASPKPRLDSAKSVEVTLLEREAERRAAYTRLDSLGVAVLLSASYVAPSNETPRCFHDRALAIKAVIKHRDAVGPYPINSMTSESTRVRVYGTTAVVTGIETISMAYTKQQPPVQ